MFALVFGRIYHFKNLFAESSQGISGGGFWFQAMQQKQSTDNYFF